MSTKKTIFEVHFSSNFLLLQFKNPFFPPHLVQIEFSQVNWLRHWFPSLWGVVKPGEFQYPCNLIYTKSVGWTRVAWFQFPEQDTFEEKNWIRSKVKTQELWLSHNGLPICGFKFRWVLSFFSSSFLLSAILWIYLIKCLIRRFISTYDEKVVKWLFRVTRDDVNPFIFVTNFTQAEAFFF